MFMGTLYKCGGQNCQPMQKMETVDGLIPLLHMCSRYMKMLFTFTSPLFFYNTIFFRIFTGPLFCFIIDKLKEILFVCLCGLSLFCAHPEASRLCLEVKRMLSIKQIHCFSP